MGYKPGDKVRIITKTKLKASYYRKNGKWLEGEWHHFFFKDCCFRNEMTKFCGEIATIDKKIAINFYKLDIDGHKWCWKEDMLFPIKEKKKKKFLTSFEGC